ncbi:MAG: hypothetical protein KIT60_11595 [Burkholderiaceae bacterium]|nr:hypothetical protein [Burkholderiaceae bacterium]
MKFNRRQIVKVAGVAAMAACLPLAAQAQAKKLTIIVGFPPGGAPDTVARALVEGLRAGNYTAIVENKGGAGGRLAADALKAAPADGSTIMIVPAGVLTIYPHIYKQLRYDPQSDFAPLAAAGEFKFGVAVGPAVPASVKSVPDFVAWAKANPKQAQFGSPGGGTAMHFIGIELGRAGKFEFQHVPYRGGAPAMSDLMGGQVPSIFTTLPLLIQPHKAGKLRILGHSGEVRSKAIPEVQTFKEAGYPGLTMGEMFVIVVNSKTPEPLQKELAAALAAASATPTVKDALEKAGFEQLTLPPAEVSARLKADYERWGKVVKETGYKAED